jgi:hypothetical protein
MKSDSAVSEGLSSRGQPPKGTLFSRPITRLGWWAFGLFAAFVVLFFLVNPLLMYVTNFTALLPTMEEAPWLQTILILFGFFMILCGFAAAVVGLVALIKNRERSWMVWLAVLPGAFLIFFLLGEFLVPH